METSAKFPRTSWREGRPQPGARVLAEEAAVAISYNGSTHAVLMATPADLEDLGVGFSVTEGIVDSVGAIEDVAVVRYELGLDVQIRVSADIAARLARRRRSMAGPVGCGMCGLESLEAATRRVPPVKASARFSTSTITEAAQSLELGQALHQATSAVHAAGFFRPAEAVSLVREDVGRHNALDKLIGALLRARVPICEGGFFVTSRVSVELIQKTAAAGSGLIAAISAPTTFAVRTAAETGVTLVAIVRGQAFEVFTRTDRITPGVVAHVA